MLLAEKITNALKEVLTTPLRSVLPAFLETQESTPRHVSAHENEILEIRQDLQVLRHELARSSMTERFGGRAMSGVSDNVKAKIFDMLEQGAPPKVIAHCLGVSLSYVYQLRNRK